MVKKLLRRLAPAGVSCLWAAAVLTAHAQSSAPTATRPDPLDAKADVPAVRYESSLLPAARAVGAAPLTWREANDAVARIGGWRVYAREAQQPDPAAATRPAPAVAPASTAAPATPATPTPPAHAGHQH